MKVRGFFVIFELLKNLKENEQPYHQTFSVN